MDKASITPERLAELAQQFVSSEFGIEFLSVVKAQQSNYRALADAFTTPQETALRANERAAGIGEVLAFIDNQVLFAEHPEYFNSPQNPIDN